MAKRKRNAGSSDPDTTKADGSTLKVTKTNGHIDVKTNTSVIQVITGSYERVLHGVTASISASSPPETSQIQFADTFLFNAHASAIRCLALSPLPDPGSSESQGVYLASGGTDEKINVYRLAVSAPVESDKLPSMPTLGINKVIEDPRNRELGTLMQHSSTITALYFPTRSKLLSASEDNTIVISRTKDLTVVSTVKAPNPKVQGQPSGDTAPAGATPAGVNDFAVHPSMKLMVSVGRGEKCMRLWNLVTGKKAGVLNFGREILQSVKESKYSSGEGRKIRWNPNGNEFTVAFERGAVIFGEDSKSKCKIIPQPVTKLHQINYLTLSQQSGENLTLLAVSTEDGRILFYSTRTPNTKSSETGSIPDARCCAQMGGKPAGISGRIKDFEVIQMQDPVSEATSMMIVTASSDGAIKVWQVSVAGLISSLKGTEEQEIQQVGSLIGTYETGSRITCLKAFLMQPAGDDAGLSEFEDMKEDGEYASSESESGDED